MENADRVCWESVLDSRSRSISGFLVFHFGTFSM